MSYLKPKHQFRDQTSDQIEELLSYYLLDSWSYSAVTSFARNEKAFEMQYIYCIAGKSSATTIAGTAYHAALQLYFECMREGIILDLAALETRAFQVIEEVPANAWKLQKTTPTIEESVSVACKTVSMLLANFLSEISVYSSEIKEILGVEVYLDEWISVNGVDIPLPCHCRIDLPILTNENKRVIIDHKSKRAFSDDKELAFSSGKQAITYAICYETATGIPIDEVWFIENKFSQNRDKSNQLVCTKIILDKDTRRLYEAMLYEPLKRVLEAISNPDYVYLINENDNFTDMAEIHEFWAQTMIAEVDDFVNIPDNKKELIRSRQRKIRDASLASMNPSVIKKFRENASQFIQYDLSNKNMTNGEKIEHVLRTFGINVQVQHIFNGYSSSTFLMAVAPGFAIANIQRHRLDIANALDVSSVRIMKDLFVHENKSYLAVECARKRDEDLLFDPQYLSGRRIPLGLDNFKRPVVWDLDNQSTPHMLICGATGCLAADTNISCYMPHYKRHSKPKTIETLFKIQNGAPNKQTHLVNKDKKDILVRCLDESTNKFTYTSFEVVYSGKKQCYKMVTDSGQTIECTEDHKFLSTTGWRKLSELNVGDTIMYRPSVREFKGKQKQIPIKDVFVKFHPKGRIRIITDKKTGKEFTYYRLPLHHFIYEANKNGLSVEDYRKLLNNYDGRELFFIPDGYQIDHEDGDRRNNDPSNLQMLTINDHATKTARTAIGVFGHFHPRACTITSIDATEIKDTYDICCDGDNHNFVANNLVVHNSGKSVSIISTIEYAILSGIDKIVIFDPKFEFTNYATRANTTVFSDIEDIEFEMAFLVEEMNELVKSGRKRTTLIVFDEFADAVSQSRSGSQLFNYRDNVIGNYKDGRPKIKRECTSVDKSLEENLKILLQKGRSSGFRIIAATQRASTKVITGDSKVNFPVQVCFRVPKEIDSKVVIDENGAEALQGKGDGLLKSPEYPDIIRFQAFYKK